MVHLAFESGYTTVESAFSYVASIYPYGGKDAPLLFDSFTGSFTI
jgi:hypothetical protein